MPGVGDRLGRYTLLKRLAVGGMGEVFVAGKTGPAGFGALVALKVLRDELATDQQFIDMLADEANITRHLNHHNVVSVIDLDDDEGRYFLAMELVEGVTSERLIESLIERREKLDVGLALFIAIELCKALEYAHSRTNEAGEPLGIIHRDVTPANILISTEGEVKLTDFGIARAKGRIHQTQAGVLKGKFGYMAPEMVRYESLDARADLFCAGVVLYLLASARHPVAHASVMEAIQLYETKGIAPPSSVNPEIGPELDAIIMRALEPQPSARWQSAREMGEALQGVMLSHPAFREAARDPAARLAKVVRSVAPEAFGPLVTRETLERLASEANGPSTEDPETDDNLLASAVREAREEALREAPIDDLSFPDSSTDPRNPAAPRDRIEEPELPGAGPVGPDALDDEQTVARYEWSAEEDDDEDDDPDSATVVGLSIADVEGAPDATAASPVAYDLDPPTMIPDEVPETAASPVEDDVWGTEADPGATLLEGLDANQVRAALDRLPDAVPLEQTIAEDDDVEVDATYVRMVDPAEIPAPATSPAPVAGPIRIALGANGAPSLAGAGEGAPLASPEGLSSGVPGSGLDVGTATGRWMAGEIDAQGLEWGDDAAGRRAVATRNQPTGGIADLNRVPHTPSPSWNGGPQQLPLAAARPPQWGGGPGASPGVGGPHPGFPPMHPGPGSSEHLARPGPSFLERHGPVLAVLALAALLALGLSYVWFATDLLWPKLQIKSVPPGASVLVDGAERSGQTPMEVVVAPGRRHRIELRVDGFEPALREITEGVGRGRTYMLEVALDRTVPVLFVGPVAGQVFANDREVGRGREVRLQELPSSGQVRLRIEADGYQSYEVIFESPEKIPASLDIPLEPEKKRR